MQVVDMVAVADREVTAVGTVDVIRMGLVAHDFFFR